MHKKCRLVLAIFSAFHFILLHVWPMSVFHKKIFFIVMDYDSFRFTYNLVLRTTDTSKSSWTANASSYFFNFVGLMNVSQYYILFGDLLELSYNIFWHKYISLLVFGLNC